MAAEILTPSVQLEAALKVSGSKCGCVALFRLLLEESDEEEGDLCRICQMGEDSASNPLLQPCHCTGSLQFVHQDCIKRWLCSKIHSGDLQNLQNLQNLLLNCAA